MLSPDSVVALRVLLRNLVTRRDLRPRRIDERGRGLRHQARYGYRALENRGSLIHPAPGNLPGAVEGKHSSGWLRVGHAYAGLEHQHGENPNSGELVTVHYSILSNNSLCSDHSAAFGQYLPDFGGNSWNSILVSS